MTCNCGTPSKSSNNGKSSCNSTGVSSKCQAKRKQQEPKDECGKPLSRKDAAAYSIGPIRPSQVCKYATCYVKPLSITFCNVKDCGSHCSDSD